MTKMARKMTKPRSGFSTVTGEDFAEPEKEFKVCACECGGQVWGIHEFDRLWTYCDKCSPVETINLKERAVSKDKSGMTECQCVSSLAIVIAKFSAVRGAIEKIRFVKYDDRIFEKLHEHGGGPVSFYEINYYQLQRHDVEGMQPL